MEVAVNLHSKFSRNILQKKFTSLKTTTKKTRWRLTNLSCRSQVKHGQRQIQSHSSLTTLVPLRGARLNTDCHVQCLAPDTPCLKDKILTSEM